MTSRSDPPSIEAIRLRVRKDLLRKASLLFKRVIDGEHCAEGSVLFEDMERLVDLIDAETIT